MRISPFSEPELVATPALNTIEVAVPKATALPAELVTVGALPPGLAEAPEKVRFLAPV